MVIMKMLQFRRTLYAVNSEENSRQNPVSAKDYVESLHQNSRATLLYGKNNVLVLPVSLIVDCDFIYTVCPNLVQQFGVGR